MNYTRTASIFLILLMLFSIPALAQKGQVKGRIFDASNNEPLAFANIIIDGTTIGSTSDLDGNFLFTGLEPGFIKLVATSVGYKPKVTEDFQVTNSRATFIEIAMEPTQIKLEDFTVEASPFRKIEESPVSVRTLGIEEIEKTPGASRDISKVILSLPGVTNSVSFRNDLIVRGGGSSENKFFLDGVEIPTLNHFTTQGSSGGPTGIINTDFIREVDFYTGAFPSTRGNALSSVMEIRQIDGNKDGLRFKGTVGASDLALTFDGPINENTSYLFSARRSYLQFLFSLIRLPFLPTYNDYQFKIKTRPNLDNELTILSIGSLDKLSLNTELPNPDDYQRYLINNIVINDQWSYAIGGVYKHFRENGFDTWVLSRNYLNNRLYKYKDNDEDSIKLFDYISDEIENKARYERNMRVNGFKIIAGGGLEYAKYSNNTLRKEVINGELKDLEYDTFIRLFKWSVFGQASKSFLDENLTLSLGLRADANNYSSSMSNLLDQLSPRFSASYALSPKFTLNFNTGRYYQMPSYTSLGFRNNDGVLVNKENDIRYIRSDHLVAGIEWLPERDARVSLEGFYKHYDFYPFSVRDSVSLASKGANFGTYGDEEIISTASGRSYGLELLFQERDLKGFNIIMSYTFVRSEFLEEDEEWIPSSWDNRHLIDITVSRGFKGGWDFGFKWRYAGGSPYTPYDAETSSLISVWNSRGEALLDYSRFNTLRYKSFHQLDIRIDKTWYFDRWSLNLYFDAQNVYLYGGQGQTVLVQDLDDNGNPLINPNDPSRYLLKELEPSGGAIIPTIGIIIEI